MANDLLALSTHLGQSVQPKKPSKNLLIATWNLRAFASLTREWSIGTSNSLKRDFHALLASGEIVRQFDVVATQKVKGDLRALRDLMHWLGDDWGFLMTDSTQGSAGNDGLVVTQVKLLYSKHA